MDIVSNCTKIGIKIGECEEDSGVEKLCIKMD